jgi:membrane protease YdiL (CAAX protease family)
MGGVLEIALAVVVILFLPLRGWYRFQRKAAPSPAPIYLIETTVLTSALILLLHRHSVTLQSVGIRPVLTAKFLFDVALCLLVVIGLDVLSLRFEEHQIEKRRHTTRIATGEMPGIIADSLDNSRRLRSFLPVVIVGAAWEELCFRGTAFLFVPRTSIPLLFAGVAVSSLVFGIQHLRNGFTAVGYSTFFGLMFASLYLATHDLIAVMIAHAAGNIFATTYAAPRVARVRHEAMIKASIFLG